MDEKSITTKIFESLGQASMCWSETPTGIFDSSRATVIGDALVKDIMEGTNFSWALLQLKAGRKVQRKNWNASGQYVYMVPANSYPSVTEVARKEFGEMVPYNAYLAIKTVQNTVAPWAPSQTDVLSDDWQIVE